MAYNTLSGSRETPCQRNFGTSFEKTCPKMEKELLSRPPSSINQMVKNEIGSF